MASTSKLVVIGVLAFVALFAFVSLFDFVSPYDDEGYNVAMIRLVSEGVPLYTGQFAYHGPVPYWIKALTLKGLGLPITHQTVRFWVLGIWILSTGLLAVAIQKLARWPLAGVAGALVVGTHLFPLRFNPGHPEDFVVLCFALAIWIVSISPPWLTENIRAAVLGLIGAVLLGTKINVGVFYMLAVMAWMLGSLRGGRARNVMRWLFVAGATATPAVLMHRFLATEWQLLLVSTLGIFLATSSFLVYGFPQEFSYREVTACATSLLLGLSAIVAAGAWLGSHPKDLLDGVVLTAAKHANIFLRPLSFGVLTIPIIGIFLFASVWMLIKLRSPVEALELQSPSWLKVILSLLALAFGTLGASYVYAALVGPICWLIAFPGAGWSGTVQQRRARLFVACLGVFQVLQMFPITGAQSAWSTLPLCVCCVVLAIDGLSELACRPQGMPRGAKYFAHAVAVTALAFPLLSTLEQGITYFRMPSLGLGRSNLIRLPLATKADFDFVVASIDRYCDAVVTQPGMNSFLLWSKFQPGEASSSPVLISGWPLILTNGQENREIAKLRGDSRVCAVYNRQASDWWTNDGPELTPAVLAAQPLVSYIRDLRPIRRVGDYEIRGNAAAEPQWGDDYVLNGERTIQGGHNGVGIPSDLLLSGPGAELVFGFQASRPGPLLSIQQPDTDWSASSGLLTQIADNGALIVAGAPRSDVPVNARQNVLDGRWHEMKYVQQGAGWEVSLDGVPAGRLPDFLASSKGRQTLEVGAVLHKNSAGSDGWLSFYGKLRDIRVRRAPKPTSPKETRRGAGLDSLYGS